MVSAVWLGTIVLVSAKSSLTFSIHAHLRSFALSFVLSRHFPKTSIAPKWTTCPHSRIRVLASVLPCLFPVRGRQSNHYHLLTPLMSLLSSAFTLLWQQTAMFTSQVGLRHDEAQIKVRSVQLIVNQKWLVIVVWLIFIFLCLFVSACVSVRVYMLPDID